MHDVPPRPCSVRISLPPSLSCGGCRGAGEPVANPFVQTTFGFDTACKVFSQLIGNMATDAASAAKYYYFTRVMGRESSQIALECALQTQPTLVLVGEEFSSARTSLKAVVYVPMGREYGGVGRRGVLENEVEKQGCGPPDKRHTLLGVGCVGAVLSSQEQDRGRGCGACCCWQALWAHRRSRGWGSPPSPCLTPLFRQSPCALVAPGSCAPPPALPIITPCTRHIPPAARQSATRCPPPLSVHHIRASL